MTDQKTVLVTGSGGGIGEGTARVLAARGWHVLVNDLDPARVAKVASEIGGTALPGDVASEPDALIARAIAVTGRLDGLVNNAGIVRRIALADLTAENIDSTMAVNLRGLMLLSKAALPHLVKTGGAIVNLASYTADHPLPGAGAYSVSKCGVVGFTKLAALEWGPLGIRVNAIGPGMIDTPMATSLRDPVKYEHRRRLVPLGRIGTPEEAGKVIAFLLSDDAAYVSGQVIMVDGGQGQGLSAQRELGGIFG